MNHIIYKNKIAKLLIWSSLPIFCYSCAANMYAPTPLNMPLAKCKNEGKIKLYTGLNESGYQASYAVLNHILVHANGSYYSHKDANGSSLRTLIEGGFGLFQKIENNGSFEILGGYGYGMGKGGYNNPHYVLYGGPVNKVTDLDGDYYKYFIQPDIGFSHHNFDFGIGFRYAILNVKHLTYSENYVNPKTNQTNYGYSGSYNNDKIYLLEPCIHVGLGDGFAKVYLSAGSSTFQKGSPDNILLIKLFMSYFVSVGITLNINRKWDD